jgi:hypothetical protein
MNQATLYGMRVYESPLAVKPAKQAKPYARRRAKSASHCRRMNKKWLKRYGSVSEPCMFMTNGSLIVHPTLMGTIRSIGKGGVNAMIDEEVSQLRKMGAMASRSSDTLPRSNARHTEGQRHA